jgi:hypothetical protein
VSEREPWIRVEHVREERRPETRIEAYRSVERFDRIAFAMLLLSKVPLHRMTVAVYERRGDLRVERGRRMPQSPTWAMIGIPPYASREHIALAVAEIAGVARVPFVVDLLARQCDGPVA